MPDDVMLNKAAVIERSLRRVIEIYRADPELSDMMHIDALTLNIERACQAAIDLAMHVVASKHLGRAYTLYSTKRISNLLLHCPKGTRSAPLLAF
mgnify:CR=1 FL=1